MLVGLVLSATAQQEGELRQELGYSDQVDMAAVAPRSSAIVSIRMCGDSWMESVRQFRYQRDNG